MGTTAIAKRLDHDLGPLLDTMRGPVPRSLLCYWCAAETGGDQFAVSTDKVLIEVGLSQAPLARARALKADPFDLVGGAWLHCYEANADHKRWSQVGRGRDILYLMLLDYSIGGGATRHVVSLTEHYRGRGDTIEARAKWIALNVDLSLPPHVHYWGRQSGELVAKRLVKQGDRLDAAAKIGTLDAPVACEPPTAPPEGVPPFPTDLVPMAKVCANREASPDEHRSAWERVRAYAKRRRNAERMSKAPIVWRAARLLSRWGTLIAPRGFVGP